MDTKINKRCLNCYWCYKCKNHILNCTYYTPVNDDDMIEIQEYEEQLKSREETYQSIIDENKTNFFE